MRDEYPVHDRAAEKCALDREIGKIKYRVAYVISHCKNGVNKTEPQKKLA